MPRMCRGCGTLFQPRMVHYYLCPACWSSSQGYQPKGEALDQIRTNLALAEARDEIRTLKRLLSAAEERAMMAVTAQAESIPPDLLKVLLLLCHPDKHNGSKASTKATQWLLEQRGKIYAR